MTTAAAPSTDICIAVRTGEGARERGALDEHPPGSDPSGARWLRAVPQFVGGEVALLHLVDICLFLSCGQAGDDGLCWLEFLAAEVGVRDLAVDVGLGQGADTGNAVSVSAGEFGHFGRELLLMADYAANEVLPSPWRAC
jgi:hypothetical protein